jgi:hypothetical protein
LLHRGGTRRTNRFRVRADAFRKTGKSSCTRRGPSLDKLGMTMGDITVA